MQRMCVGGQPKEEKDACRRNRTLNKYDTKKRDTNKARVNKDARQIEDQGMGGMFDDRK